MVTIENQCVLLQGEILFGVIYVNGNTVTFLGRPCKDREPVWALEPVKTARRPHGPVICETNEGNLRSL